MTNTVKDMSWFIPSPQLQLCCCNDCQEEAERRIGQGDEYVKQPRSLFGGRLEDNFFVICHDAYAKKGGVSNFLKSEHEMTDEEKSLCFAAQQLSWSRHDY